MGGERGRKRGKVYIHSAYLTTASNFAINRLGTYEPSVKHYERRC